MQHAVIEIATELTVTQHTYFSGTNSQRLFQHTHSCSTDSLKKKNYHSRIVESSVFHTSSCALHSKGVVSHMC